MLCATESKIAPSLYWESADQSTVEADLQLLARAEGQTLTGWSSAASPLQLIHQSSQLQMREITHLGFCLTISISPIAYF